MGQPRAGASSEFATGCAGRSRSFPAPPPARSCGGRCRAGRTVTVDGNRCCRGPRRPLIEVLRQLGAAKREVAASGRLAEDLHLDSLALMQLQSALETRFGLELDDAVWEQVKTVGDLRGLLNRHPPGISMSPVEASRPAAASTPLTAVPSQTAHRTEEAVFPRGPGGRRSAGPASAFWRRWRARWWGWCWPLESPRGWPLRGPPC